MVQEFVDNGFFISKGKKKKNIVYYLEYLLLILMEWGYKFLLLFGRKQKPKKYYVSFCSIFKNEAPYMKEWIEYHLLVGVDHFYLYNNNSTDNYLEVLQPYIDKGIVTLTEWPEVPGQITAYKHFYETFRNETNWVSFLDLDEFICPKRETIIADWPELTSLANSLSKTIANTSESVSKLSYPQKTVSGICFPNSIPAHPRSPSFFLASLALSRCSFISCSNAFTSTVIPLSEHISDVRSMGNP